MPDISELMKCVDQYQFVKHSVPLTAERLVMQMDAPNSIKPVKVGDRTVLLFYDPANQEVLFIGNPHQYAPGQTATIDDLTRGQNGKSWDPFKAEMWGLYVVHALKATDEPAA